jgi:hypothetical protein
MTCGGRNGTQPAPIMHSVAASLWGRVSPLPSESGCGARQTRRRPRRLTPRLHRVVDRLDPLRAAPVQPVFADEKGHRAERDEGQPHAACVDGPRRAVVVVIGWLLPITGRPVHQLVTRPGSASDVFGCVNKSARCWVGCRGRLVGWFGYFVDQAVEGPLLTSALYAVLHTTTTVEAKRLATRWRRGDLPTGFQIRGGSPALSAAGRTLGRPCIPFSPSPPPIRHAS